MGLVIGRGLLRVSVFISRALLLLINTLRKEREKERKVEGTRTLVYLFYVEHAVTADVPRVPAVFPSDPFQRFYLIYESSRLNELKTFYEISMIEKH